ncbi:xylulokinase [Rathayibacter soli]|uniref:xylulokinase n=1 Tax=Rathayibacter soli TaxID=3144168 RepID=UPI0027E41EB6|nr:FGGY-family carbohydrate kinase [Glaciibacter superstes]
MDNGPAVIGIDLGTSSVKVIAVAQDASVLGRTRRSYPTARPVAGAAEQSPKDWLNALKSALGELAGVVDPQRWAAFGLSAMLPTLVELDAVGNPVGPAITWEDGRAEGEGARLRELLGPDHGYRLTGARIDGRYLLPMHERRRASAGHGYAGAERARDDADLTIAGAKDYLFQALTGELLTDPSTAAGFGCFDIGAGRWDDTARALLGDVRLPEIAASGRWLPLRAELADSLGCGRVPVVLGAADSVLGAYGLGVTAAGQTAYIAGTSTVILTVSRQPVFDREQRFLVTPMAEVGYGLEMDLLATGSALAWLAELLGLSGGPAELVALASDAPASAAPVFLPYLAPGEQGALWDPRLAGAVNGLSLGTTRASLARGLLNGIIVESRRCLAVLDGAVAAGAAEPICVSGASATSALFRQDLADAAGRPVSVAGSEHDHSALGAAYWAAGAALDWSLEPASHASIIEPDPTRSALWDDRAAEHDAGRRALYPEAAQ